MYARRLAASVAAENNPNRIEPFARILHHTAHRTDLTLSLLVVGPQLGRVVARISTTCNVSSGSLKESNYDTEFVGRKRGKMKLLCMTLTSIVAFVSRVNGFSSIRVSLLQL